MAQLQTVAPAQLARLSGLTERRLRELAAEGWFPRAAGGQYQLVPAIQGLLRYYREKDQSRVLQEVYDSITSCSTSTGIPMATLKHAKRSGRGAFRGSRVYLPALIRWLFEARDRTAVDYEQERAQNLVLQNARLQFELSRIRGEMLSAQDVYNVGARLGQAIRRVVGQLHLQAPTLVELTTAQLDLRLKDIEDQVLTQLHSLDQNMATWKATADQTARSQPDPAVVPLPVSTDSL
ncbi:MAG: hypothetical protein HS113_29175 [Verrucomicrobiales bacterium]|nr:hypothetical protein [Verrucomicrobiales bacterium]